MSINTYEFHTKEYLLRSSINQSNLLAIHCRCEILLFFSHWLNLNRAKCRCVRVSIYLSMNDIQILQQTHTQKMYFVCVCKVTIVSATMIVGE